MEDADDSARTLAALSKQIRIELLERDMTQQDLADAVPVSRATMNHYLMGHRNIPMPTLFRVAEIFGVKPSELLGRAADRMAR